MSVPIEPSPASAAYRASTGSVEVRNDRGQLLYRASADQVKAAQAAGIGRLVAGGRVLRVRNSYEGLAELHAASRFTQPIKATAEVRPDGRPSKYERNAFVGDPRIRKEFNLTKIQQN